MKLNLGSGQRPFSKEDGWLNCDVQSKDYEVDVVLDLAAPLPFGDNEAEIVVLHQVLEHMDAFREGQALLKECYRVLKPGGSLIVTVPDTRALARRYLLGMIDSYTFRVNMHGAFMGAEFDRHRWSYDWGELAEKMMCAPWKEVKGFDWRVIDGADIAQDWWILGVEGVK